MTATILDGKATAAAIKSELAARVVRPQQARDHSRAWNDLGG